MCLDLSVIATEQIPIRNIESKFIIFFDARPWKFKTNTNRDSINFWELLFNLLGLINTFIDNLFHWGKKLIRFSLYFVFIKKFIWEIVIKYKS